MFRKLLLVAVAAFTVGVASLATMAPADARRGGFFLPGHGGGFGMRPNFGQSWGGGGRHWGGGGWGGRRWGGGGWGHRRWYGGGYGRRWRDDGWGWGAGLALAPLLLTPGLYGGYGGGYGGGYYDDGFYDYAPACRWRRVRVYTDWGWRIRRQRVCY